MPTAAAAVTTLQHCFQNMMSLRLLSSRTPASSFRYVAEPYICACLCHSSTTSRAVMLTCQHVCLCSLHHSLSKVYCPMLKLEQPGSSSSTAAVVQPGKQLDPQLGELLLNVQAGLAKAVRGAAGPGDSLQVCAGLCASRYHHYQRCMASNWLTLLVTKSELCGITALRPTHGSPFPVNNTSCFGSCLMSLFTYRTSCRRVIRVQQQVRMVSSVPWMSCSTGVTWQLLPAQVSNTLAVIAASDVHMVLGAMLFASWAGGCCG